MIQTLLHDNGAAARCGVEPLLKLKQSTTAKAPEKSDNKKSKKP